MRFIKNIFPLLLLTISSQLWASDIKVKGEGKGEVLSVARGIALHNARVALMKEEQKILLTWTKLYYKDYDFEKVSRAVSLRASSYITKEKIRKKKGIYKVTVTLKLATYDKDLTEQFLDSFEQNLYKVGKDIEYNRAEARKTLYKVISRW